MKQNSALKTELPYKRKNSQKTGGPSNLTQVGGTPAILKYLNAKGYINADCMTVTCECCCKVEGIEVRS